jgi:hypothetical protein
VADMSRQHRKKGTMKKNLLLSLALALAICAPAHATSTTQPGVKVAATATNTTTDFAADVRSVCIANSGANEVFYAFGVAAVATAGVNEIGPGVTVCFDEIEFATVATTGSRSAIVGIICSAAETSTVSLYAVARQ